nr:hypothetical protein [Candidatus Sigynarchaeota archaeon]
EELSIFMHRVACGMCDLHDRCTVQEPASCSPIITVHALLKNVNGIDIDCSCATIELLSCKELPVEIIMSASADGTFSIFADSALASELLHGSGGDLP